MKRIGETKAEFPAETSATDPNRLAYQPECNTSNLREFLKKHSFLLSFLTIVSPAAGIGFYLLTIGLPTILYATVTGRDIGSEPEIFRWAYAFFPLLFFPVTAMITLRLARIVFQPTHLLLRPDGLYVQWQQRLKRPVKKLVLWKDVTYIDLEQIENKTKDREQFVVFKTKDADPKKAMKVKISGIIDPEGPARLLNAIREHAADVPRNPELTTLLEPAPESSYTELWLTALSAPPERESLSPLEPGALLKNCYKITRKIAMGGQGTAYAAVNTLAKDGETDLVLKEYILPTQVGTKAKSESIETLRNEAEILSKLDHKNIVRLIDYFVQDHRGYLALEHVDGKNLRELLACNEQLSEQKIVQLALQMCDMLIYLHAQSPAIVHRDFTPDNLILTEEGTVKLIDFNVARQTTSTVTATVVGKHSYISLEQFRGKPSPQSDIYSMGCILHYLATGEDPEPLTSSSPIHLRNDLSAEFNTIVERATELETKFRYENAEILKSDLLKLSNPAEQIL